MFATNSRRNGNLVQHFWRGCSTSCGLRALFFSVSFRYISLCLYLLLLCYGQAYDIPLAGLCHFVGRFSIILLASSRHYYMQAFTFSSSSFSAPSVYPLCLYTMYPLPSSSKV